MRARVRKSEWKRTTRGNARGKRREGVGARGREGVKRRRRRRRSAQGQERRDKERTDETTGAGEKEITAGSDRVVEINVARLIGATEECACGPSGSQLARARLRAVRTATRFAISRARSVRVPLVSLNHRDIGGE